MVGFRNHVKMHGKLVCREVCLMVFSWWLRAKHSAVHTHFRALNHRLLSCPLQLHYLAQFPGNNPVISDKSALIRFVGPLWRSDLWSNILFDSVEQIKKNCLLKSLVSFLALNYVASCKKKNGCVIYCSVCLFSLLRCSTIQAQSWGSVSLAKSVANGPKRTQ